MTHVWSRRTVLSSWVVLLALGALCQIALKYAGLETGPFDFSARAFAAAAASAWLWVAVACYVGEFLAWMVILRHSALSSAFPTGAIVLIVLMFASRWLFDEPVGWSKLLGSAMIAAGVLLLGPDHPAGTPAAGEREDALPQQSDSSARGPT
jgi:drug/metabolite transporter (DMT)-like permease